MLTQKLWPLVYPVLAAGVAFALASPGRAAVVPTLDNRMIHAEVSTIGGSPDQQTDAPGAMADFNYSVDALSFTQCEDPGGLQWTVLAQTSATQWSRIQATSMRGIGSATAGLPDPCEQNTSTGVARSLFEVTFTTDIAYQISINGPVDNALVQLSHPSGSGPVFLLNHSGTLNVVFDAILAPNTYTIRALAEADEDGETPDYDVMIGFSEVPPSSGAGTVAQLAIGKVGAGDLQLDWQPSCSSDDDDYAVYGGDLGDFTSHTLEQCSSGAATTAVVSQPVGDRYYLVVPLDGASEGSYGTDSDGFERPVGVATCATQAIATPCP